MGGLGFTLAAAGAALVLFRGDGRFFARPRGGRGVSPRRPSRRPHEKAPQGQPRPPSLSEDLLSARRRPHCGVLLPVRGPHAGVSSLLHAHGRSLVRHRAARGPRLSRDGEQRQSDGRAGRARGVPSRRSFSSFWVHCSRCRAWEAGWKCSPSALPGRLPPILCSTLTAPASLWGTRARSRSGDLRRRSRSFRGTRSFCPFWGRCSLYPAYPSSCRS